MLIGGCEGVERRWLVSVDSLHALRASRTATTDSPRTDREHIEADSIADVLREMSVRLEMRTAEAVEMRTRLELSERAQSTVEEEARKLWEENEQLRAELEAERSKAERSKGFLKRLFGG
jgi:predicted nuclease with TOPRIM domain